MPRYIHIHIDEDMLKDGVPNTLPFYFSEKGKLYRGEEAKVFLDSLHRSDDVSYLQMSHEESEKFKANILPHLPRPNIQNIHSSNNRYFNPMQSGYRATYMMEPKLSTTRQLSELSDILVDANENAVTFLKGVARVLQQDTSSYARTLYRKTHSNRATYQEFLRRNALQGISDKCKQAAKVGEKYVRRFEVANHLAKAAEWYNDEGYSGIGAIARTGYDYATGYVETGIKVAVNQGARAALAIGLEWLGIELTGGLSLLVPFVVGESAEYIVVEYVWNPSVKWLENTYENFCNKSAGDPTSIGGVSSHRTSPLMGSPINSTTGYRYSHLPRPDYIIPGLETTENPMRMSCGQTLPQETESLSWLVRMVNDSFVIRDQKNALFPNKTPSSEDKIFVTKRLDNIADFDKKVSSFQQYVKEHFDYSNPNFQDPSTFFHSNFTHYFRPYQNNTPMLPGVSAYLNNYSGRWNWGVEVDVGKQPVIAAALLGAHVIKSMYYWLRMDPTDKCKARIQALINNLEEHRNGNIFSVNTPLRVFYNPDGIMSRHQRKLSEEFSKLHDLNPSSGEVSDLTKIMSYFIKKNNLDALLAFSKGDENAVRKYIEDYSNDFQGYVYTASQALKESNIQKAEEIYEKLKNFPSEAMTYAIGASVFCNKGQYQEGQNALAKARELAENSLRLASTAEVKTDVQSQQDYIERVEIGLHQNMYYASSWADRESNWQKWLALSKAYATSHPRNVRAGLDLANVYLAENKNTEAIDVYNELYEQGVSSSPSFLFDYGKLLHNNNRIDEAIAVFEKFKIVRSTASEHVKNCLYVALLIENIYIERFNASNDSEILEKMVQQAEYILGLPIQDIELLSEQAKLLGVYKDSEKGLEYLNKFYTEAENNQEATLLLGKIKHAMGDCYTTQKDFKNATECYKQALITNPDDVSLLVSYGRTNLCCANLQEAEQALKRAEAIDPNNPGLLQAQKHMGEYIESARNTLMLQAAFSAASIGLDKIQSLNWGSWQSVAKMSCAFGKIAIPSMPFVIKHGDCIKFFCNGAFDKANVIAQKLGCTFRFSQFTTNMQNKTPAEIDSSRRQATLDAVNLLFSAVLILDQASGNDGTFRLSDNMRELVTLTSNILSITSGLQYLSNLKDGVAITKEINELFGAAVANQVMYLDAGAIIIPKIIDAAEFLANQYGNGVSESALYHFAKCSLQGASLGMIFGKAAAAAGAGLLKGKVLGVVPEPTVVIVGTTIFVGVGVGYSLYETSQLNTKKKNISLLVERGDINGALRAITHVCKEYPDEIDLKLTRCQLSVNQDLKSGNVPKAIQRYESFKRKYPREFCDSKNAVSHLESLKITEEAKTYVKGNQCEKAIELLEAHTTKDPDDVGTQQFLLFVYGKKWDALLNQKGTTEPLSKRLDAAIVECDAFKQKYIACSTSASEALEKLKIYRMAAVEGCAAAISYVDGLILSADDNNTEKELLTIRHSISQQRVFDLSEEGNYDQAIVEAKDHLSVYPEDKVIKEKLGLLRCIAPLTKRDYQETISACNEKLSTTDENDMDTLRYRARAYMGENKLYEAEKDLQKIISHSPSDHDTFFQRGLLYSRRGYLKKPLDDTNRAISILEEQVSSEEAKEKNTQRKRTLKSYRKFADDVQSKIDVEAGKAVVVSVASIASATMSHWMQSAVLREEASMPVMGVTYRVRSSCAPSTNSAIRQFNLR